MAGGVEAKLPKLPIEMQDADLQLYMNPPEIGEHSQEILSGLGFSSAEIDDLAKEKIIFKINS